MSKLKLITQSHHRNGSGHGLPFSVAIFRYGGQRMIGIVLDNEEGEDPPTDDIGCFVLNLDKAAAGDIAFGSNSFDGEGYYAELCALIKQASDREYEALCKRQGGSS